MKKTIYIGYDSSNYGQKLAFDVCKKSLLKYNQNLNIIQLNKKELEDKNIFNRNDNTGSTEFTYTRFLSPYLYNTNNKNDINNNWVLFCDSDFLWCCDVEEIFDTYNDPKYAVYCVKHKYTNCFNKYKMDGKKQEWYPKKNWSSLMLFNCSHPSIKNLNINNINTKSPQWLHRMEWCKEEEIGEIDKKYNYLVGYYNDNKYKALHYTDGGPWYLNFKNCEFSNEWLNYLNEQEKKNLYL